MADSWDTRPPDSPKKPKAPKAKTSPSPKAAKAAKSPGTSDVPIEPTTADPISGSPPNANASAAGPRAAAYSADGGWMLPPAEKTARLHFRMPRRWVQEGLLAVSVTVAVSMAISAALSRPMPLLHGVGERPKVRPVIAQVMQSPGDARSVGDVCAAYNVPKNLCDLSQICAAQMGQGPAGRRRVVRLILMAPNATCPDVSDQPTDAGGP